MELLVALDLKEFSMRIAIVSISLLLSACSGPVQETTNVSGYEIKFLFEKDGCRMYRFYDSGTRWFMTCGNGDSSVIWQESKDGKTIDQEDITTRNSK